MEALNGNYIYAGLLNGIARFYQKTKSDIGIEECWSNLSEKKPWLFTEELNAIYKDEIFQKAELLNRPTIQKEGNSLQSIFFELLPKNGNTPLDAACYLKPAKFGLDESIFPTGRQNTYLELINKLYAEFETELQNLKTEKFTDLEKWTALYELLKKYTSTIPLLNNEIISVFENAKLNSALSHCLSLADNSDLPYLLVSGDISGIQSFIYNISNKRAMVSLKGRSFYVELLAETIAKELTTFCGVTLTHQIYAAGGKFYILCPNNSASRKNIQTYRKEIQEWIWGKFNGTISIQVESIPFELKIQDNQLHTNTELEENLSVGHLWKLLSDKISESKKRKFDHLIINKFETFFNASGQGGEIKVCAVSNEELTDKNLVLVNKDLDEGGDLFVSKAVNEQIKIGKKLYAAKFLIETPTQTSDSFQVGVNTHWKLDNQLPSSPQKRCLAINQQTILPVYKNSMIIENRLIGGIPMAGFKESPATLEDLCKNEDRTENLGVLRMDVDNLGSLFMHGFGTYAGFSLMATLSTALETYFSGYLNTIRNQEKYKQCINIVYAGGDDVFAVGRWDKIIDFAIEVKAGFKKMVCGREDISISGGVAIVGAKFPIAKAAEVAAEAEDLAKDYENNGKQKNALTLFCIPVSFETEIPFVIEFKNDLTNWISNKQISRGLLFKLFEYYQMYLDKKPDWQWQSAYTIARYEEACSSEQKINYKALKELLFTKKYKNEYYHVRFEAIIVACRWAELLTKNHK